MNKIGILGLSLSGKTTIFSILAKLSPSRRSRERHPPTIVEVPDERLEKLKEIFSPPRSIPVQLEFVETPNIKSEDGRWKFDVTFLREVDGIILVLRAFTSEFAPLPEGGIDPARDLRVIQSELILADLEIIEKRLEKLTKDRSRTKIEGKKETLLLETCRAHLEKESPLIYLRLNEDEERFLSGYQFVSRLPILAVVNVGEKEISKFSPEELKNKIDDETLKVIACSARIEEEISELDEKEKDAFLADLALKEPARERIIRSIYELRGFITFFTIAEKEIHAWAIERGTLARAAAGKVHSDMEKGFIRAEVINFAEFIKHGSYDEAKKHGQLRLEGKEYPVLDGDMIKFRFSV